MEWFTPAWHSGDLEDQQPGSTEDVRAAYWSHIEGLVPQMPAAVRELATTAQLHDGQVHRWEHGDGVLAVDLIVGDKQVGYSRLSLEYTSAQVRPEGVSLSDLTSEDVEILYEEVAAAPAGRWEHRLLLWPYREVTIVFSEVTLSSTPASATDRT
jgi:hypothetical protein